MQTTYLRTEVGGRADSRSVVSDKSKIGAEVRRLRIEAGWSQADLGHRAGMREETVQRIEVDKTSPHRGTRRLLALAFGLEIDAFERGGP